MAVNDITKILDFQSQRPTEVSPPEPVQRREPSDYQKALTRSVTSNDKPKPAERPDKPKRHPPETEAVSKDTRPQPAESRRQDERTEPTPATERSNAEQNRSVSEKPAAADDRPVHAANNKSETATADANTVQDDAPAISPEIADSKTDGLVATPPANLNELFPKTEPPKQADKLKADSGDETLAPPQGFILSLKAAPKKAEQSDARTGLAVKPPAIVEWNEALWNKPQSGDAVQNGEKTGDQQAVQKTKPFEVKTDLVESVATSQESTATSLALNQTPIQPTNDVNEEKPAESTFGFDAEQTVAADYAADVAAQVQINAQQNGQAESNDTTSAHTPVNGVTPTIKSEKPKNTKKGDDAKPHGSQQPVTGVPVAAAVAPTATPVADPSEKTDESSAASVKPAAVTSVSGPKGVQPIATGSATSPDVIEAGGTKAVSNSRASEIGANKGASGLTTAERADFAERVMNAVRGAAEQNRPFRVHLNPPELGSLQVEITQRDGVYSARLEVQTSSAQQALLDHIGHLKESLQHSGIRLDRIDVQLNPAGPDDQTQDGGEQRQQHNGGQQQRDNSRGQQRDSGRHADDSFADSLAAADELVDLQV